MALTPTPLDPLHVQAVIIVGTDGSVTTFPAAGTPGAAVPSTGMPVGGTDGTNFYLLHTDTSGNLFVRGGNTPGSAVPLTGLFVGGTDGTNYRPFKTDTGGNLIVQGLSGGQPMPIAGSTANTVMSSTNPISVNITNGTNAAAITTSASDALAWSTAASLVKSLNYALGPTNGDRVRTIQLAKTVSTGLGVLAVEAAGRPSAHITTAATTTPVSGAGIIDSLDILTPIASATITVYDSLTASGTVLAVITLPSDITGFAPCSVLRNRAFATGLTIVTSAATDLNVCYRN